jgi:hypothetical protein
VYARRRCPTYSRLERGSAMDRLIGLADLAVMLTLVAVVVLIAIL